MHFILIAFITMIVYYVFLMADYERAKKQLKEEKENRNKVAAIPCPPEAGGIHKWSYHPQTGLLTCNKCNFVAGSS